MYRYLLKKNAKLELNIQFKLRITEILSKYKGGNFFLNVIVNPILVYSIKFDKKQVRYKLLSVFCHIRFEHMPGLNYHVSRSNNKY